MIQEFGKNISKSTTKEKKSKAIRKKTIYEETTEDFAKTSLSLRVDKKCRKWTRHIKNFYYLDCLCAVRFNWLQ